MTPKLGKNLQSFLDHCIFKVSLSALSCFMKHFLHVELILVFVQRQRLLLIQLIYDVNSTVVSYTVYFQLCVLFVSFFATRRSALCGPRFEALLHWLHFPDLNTTCMFYTRSSIKYRTCAHRKCLHITLKTM